MSDENSKDVSRRTFVRRGLIAGGTLLGADAASAPAARAAEPSPEPLKEVETVTVETPPGELPRRILGRTNVPVTMLTLGTATCGDREPREIADLVNAGLDEGINFVDTSQNYGNAQEGVGLGLGKRRKEIFLSTKVFANSIKDAEKSLEKSIRLLKTDCFDLLYYHGLGCLNIEGAMDPDGVFTWLLKQKKAGKCRFLGVSAHKLPGRCAQFLETGEVDVFMPLTNFIDRNTYGFEDKTFSIARKRNIGIVAMKVFGGIRKKKPGVEYARQRSTMDPEHLELSVRYALSTPGIVTANIGPHNVEQLRQNVNWVKNFKPLAPEEMRRLEELGQKLAPTWGEHLGPVAEENPPKVRTV